MGAVAEGRVAGSGIGVVSTTGIYCRADCSARPLPANVGPVSSPAAAEAAGFRPCLRCRPDRLPLVLLDDAAESLVAEALTLITDGFLDQHRESDLARRVGVSPRHLRRRFVETVGATPIQVASSRRAHFARLLLDDTDLAITGIAFAAGFGSVRRMNEVMRATFRSTPSELRAKRSAGRRPTLDGGLRLHLAAGRELDFQRHLGQLATRAVPGVESVGDGLYRRSTTLCGRPGLIEVRPEGGAALEVTVHLPTLNGLIDIVSRCRRVFRLDRRHAGPPGHWSAFEAAVVDEVWRRAARPAATMALLVDRLGVEIPDARGGAVSHEFPTPASFARLADVVAGEAGGAPDPDLVARLVAIAAEAGDDVATPRD